MMRVLLSCVVIETIYFRNFSFFLADIDMEIYDGKKQHQQSSKSSRSPSPESPPDTSPEQDEAYQPVLRTPPPSRAGPPPSPPVPTNPVAPVAPEPSAPLPLMPCLVCGRTFVPQSLAKHVKICEKMTVKKRKTFDSSRQRREGTDLEQYLPKNFGLPENSPFLEKSPPNTAKPTPKTKPHSVRSAIMKPAAELQKCPHCARAFGVRAFERHVEWCADKAKILPAAPAHAAPHIADAKQRLNARTQYKAPPVRQRKSSQTREKSSNSRSASVDSSRGVSPPPPREYGDYRQGRIRASESMSSNDCHEDTSPHVPVIRNSRNSQNNSSGDANVKARQARLARDLSSSRNTQNPRSSSIQQSRTDPNIKKSQPESKPKTRMNVKKQQQLKKLEAIASKYSEDKKNEQKDNSKIRREKSLIPVPKKIKKKSETVAPTNNPPIETVLIKEEIKEVKVNTLKQKKPIHLLEATSQISLKDKTLDKKIEKKLLNKEKVDPLTITKESTMSLDSLEECPQSGSSHKDSLYNLNTELLCVPCVLHNTTNEKQYKRSSSKNKSKVNHHVKNIDSNIIEPKVELLYRNPIVVSSCDIMIPECYDDKNCSQKDLAFNSPVESILPDSLNLDNTESSICLKNYNYDDDNKKNCLLNSETNNVIEDANFESEELNNLSAENIEENYEHDLSEELFNDSADNNFEENEEKRHGSGETYTKFTENPADLDEFMIMTDKLLHNRNLNETKFEIEKNVENFHTPKTNSLETINQSVMGTIDTEGKEEPTRNFSDNFEQLKNDLKELLGDADNDVKRKLNIEEFNEDKINRQVSDMEHITVYELKFYEEESNKDNITGDYDERNSSPEFKLPSITSRNKLDTKIPQNRKKLQKIYQPNRKNRVINAQTRANKEYQTFIVKENVDSDNQSISSEAPPLKLPRIENKRLDDNYDPFESAARQMKELMSSETNVPKQIQISAKDSRTLPILRPTKDKMSTSYLSPNNTKMMKDTLNKTYQKTPTLQRMKSFGSTNSENNNSSFGGRCSSFRINRNDKKASPKLNTTFTKSSKENISTSEKNSFTRNSNLNRSFSSYTASSYSTPKPKDKMPKIATSMYHSFQRSTIAQPVKLDKINRDDQKKDFVNLDVILTDDNSSMTDSNYIDPRLINENDNLPINVNTILNNPDIISSMESLLTTENLPAKFESFSTICNNNKINGLTKSNNKLEKIETNNNINKSHTLPINDIASQYEKIMSSLEQSIASKTSVRDDDSLCEDFDLEEFMTSFDDEINKHKTENKRTCSSTTRVVKQSEYTQSNRTSELSSVSSSPKMMNGMIPVNKSMSLNFSSNNIVNDNLFPSSVKRSTSLLDSIQKKSVQKTEYAKGRNKTEQLEQDIMQSLKDFDKFYESEKIDSCHSSKETVNYSVNANVNTVKREPLAKLDRKPKKKETISNGNYTPNGKSSNDSAYSSLNRISPAKLTICNKEPNGLPPMDKCPISSDTGSSHKEDNRSISSEEFLAMERSAEIDGASPQSEQHTNYKELDNHALNDKRTSSRSSSRRSSTWKPHGSLSSSGSEASLHARQCAGAPAPAPRLSRFCHECGRKFPVDTAKFCIECGVKRLLV
ncbi:hypothetical protein O3G_MSEX002778 [Manduca sexta]|uniref:C2HC/C3H-type domain-containing protein n=1 Tax=Manduca sexta TaxID=7130 RepID=A0A922CDU4_MANSE|nr:hypothetical protein O3G_MSEX002778 [Manduca sexta]